MDIFIIIILCVIPPLFIASLAGFGILFSRNRSLKASISQAELTILEQEEMIDDIVEREGKKALATAREKIRELELNLQESIMRMEKLRSEHQSEIHNLSSKVRTEERTSWLNSMASREFKNEIEVEFKFIYPLVKYLGYSDDRFSIRHSVALKMGSQEAAGEADWVLWHHRPQGGRKPLVIIEAKAANRDLDESAVSQARSYAFAMGTPYYLVTNGRQLRLYKRGVETDERILAVDSTNFAANWEVLEEEIGAIPLVT